MLTGMCSTIADMDRIICLDAGRIIQQGTPRDLLRDTNGYFAQLSKLD